MKFIKCESCGAKIPKDEKCDFADYKRSIGGEVFIFCCAKCADEYEKKQKSKRRIKA